MANSEVLPRSVVVLGDALRPISRMLAARLDEASPRPEGRAEDTLVLVRRHLGLLETHAGRLTDEINGELGRVVAPDVSDAEVWRAAARMEVCIEGILADYDDVRRVRVDRDDLPGWSLLGDIYRDLLMQVDSWLRRVLDVIDDPVAAARKAGLASEGRVDLTIELTLEAPRQVKSVVDWAEQRTERVLVAAQQEEGDAASARSRDYGFVALLLAVFGLGWLFGDDDD